MMTDEKRSEQPYPDGFERPATRDDTRAAYRKLMVAAEAGQGERYLDRHRTHWNLLRLRDEGIVHHHYTSNGRWIIDARGTAGERAYDTRGAEGFVHGAFAALDW